MSSLLFALVPSSSLGFQTSYLFGVYNAYNSLELACPRVLQIASTTWLPVIHFVGYLPPSRAGGAQGRKAVLSTSLPLGCHAFFGSGAAGVALGLGLLSWFHVTIASSESAQGGLGPPQMGFRVALGFGLLFRLRGHSRQRRLGLRAGLSDLSLYRVAVCVRLVQLLAAKTSPSPHRGGMLRTGPTDRIASVTVWLGSPQVGTNLGHHRKGHRTGPTGLPRVWCVGDDAKPAGLRPVTVWSSQ